MIRNKLSPQFNNITMPHNGSKTDRNERNVLSMIPQSRDGSFLIKKNSNNLQSRFFSLRRQKLKQQEAKQRVEDDKQKTINTSAWSCDEVRPGDRFMSLRVKPITERIEKGGLFDGRFANNEELLSIFGLN